MKFKYALGIGKMTFPNKDVYEGQWVDDKVFSKYMT